MDDQDDFAFDYFISRCGASGSAAAEAVSVLEGAGYRVKSQDFDFARGGDFVGDIHDALVQARHLYILHTEAYDSNYWTRKEFTNFIAAAAASGGGRRVCVLRCDRAAPRGILANVVFGDISAETDPEKRRQIILDVARGDALVKRRDPPLFGGAMPAGNPAFIGREAALAELKAHFDGGGTISELRAVALVGMGGVGKTATARASIDRFASDYAGVWWVAAESRTSLLTGLAALADRLAPRSTSETDVEKAARRALRRLELSDRPYLLILDNIDDPSLLEAWAPTRGAHLLLTTRRADWFGRAHEILLDVMSPEEAIAFLQARAGRKDEAGAQRAALAVGCLPLALDHAGAYVKLTTMSFEAYAKRAESLMSKTPKGASYPMSLAATFGLAIDNAVREAPQAEACMRMFSLAAPDEIPLSIVDEAVDEDERFEALGALVSVSLVRPKAREGDEATVSVHRLVQAAMRARMGAGELVEVANQVLSRLAALFPGDSYARTNEWPRCALLLPHALSIVAHAKAATVRNDAFIVICGRVAEYLHVRASYLAAADLYRDALDAATALYGNDHSETVRISTKLGNVMKSLGRTGEADVLLRAALASTAADPGDRAAIMTSLGELLHETNRLSEAEALLREAIATSEARDGRDHPDVVVRRNNLARVLQDLGQFEEAERLFRDAIAAGEAHFGRAHPQVGDRLNNLAKLLHDRGRLDEAEALYKEAIANGEATLDPQSPTLAIRRQNLANLLRDSGRCDAAEPLYRAALSALANALPQGHSVLARVQYNLSVALHALGSDQEAKDLALAAAAAHKAGLGETHPWTAQSRMLAEKLNAEDTRNKAVRPPAS